MANKRHYKMYKSGKTWTIAAITTVFVGVGMLEAPTVLADTAAPTNQNATSTAAPAQTTSTKATSQITLKAASTPTSAGSSTQAKSATSGSSESAASATHKVASQASQTNASGSAVASVKQEQNSQSNQTMTNAAKSAAGQTSQNKTRQVASSATPAAKTVTTDKSGNTNSVKPVSAESNQKEPVKSQDAQATAQTGQNSVQTSKKTSNDETVEGDWRSEVYATINETINYIDEDDNEVAPTYHAHPVTFVVLNDIVTHTVKYYYSDKSTTISFDPTSGVVTSSDWVVGDTADFAAVTNPTINGYEVIQNDAPNSDLTAVANQSVNKKDSDLTFTVIYAKKQDEYIQNRHTLHETINYVDEQGKTVASSYHAKPVTFITVTNKTTGAKQTYYSTTAKVMKIDQTTGKPAGNEWHVGSETDFVAVNNPKVAGYEVVDNDAPDSDLDAVEAQTIGKNGHDLVYTVVYAKPDEVKYTQETHKVNETINYVDEQGKTVAPTHHAHPITFVTITNKATGAKQVYYSTTATKLIIDQNTGKPLEKGWQLASQADFAAVTNPQVNGYDVIKNDAPNSDLKAVALQTVTNQNGDLVYTVVYAMKETDPTNPTDPTTPTEPGKPVDPTTPTEPGKPVDPTIPTEPGKPVKPTTPTEPGKPVKPTTPTQPSWPATSGQSMTNKATITTEPATKQAADQNAPVYTGKQLPQTDENDQHSTWLSLIGLLTTMLTLGFGAKWWRH